MNNQKFDLKNFLPKEIHSGKKGNKYPLEVKESNDYLDLSYLSNISNFKGEGKRQYYDFIKRYVNKNKESFEVLGLLQAEMGKTQNGSLNFCNHEYQIIKKVMNWFEKELEIKYKWWKWHIKVNINEPNDLEYKKQIENKVIKHWLAKTKIDFNMKYPKTVSYIRNTRNKKLKHYDHGTLIIEYKNNILNQVIKKFVKEITYKHIINFKEKEIRNFMKGIIAGEANVEIHKKDKRFRVYITAVNDIERNIFEECLKKLNIEGKHYNFAFIISKKHNLLQLLQQKLLCLSPKKYNKFLRIFQLYSSFPDHEIWKQQQTKPHNKTPQEIIDKIIELHHQNPNNPAWKIAKQVGISTIKVQRVRKEHGLGVQRNKTTKEEFSRIVRFHKANPHLIQAQLTEQTGFAEHKVRRVLVKYRKNPEMFINQV